MVYDGGMIDPVIGTLLSGAFAVLFASAALHKLRDLGAFGAAFRAYRLLPEGVVLHGAVPAVETALAAGLLLPATRAAAALGGVALLLLYACAIGINLARGRRELACGCGGANERRPIGAWMVARNLMLGAALAVAALPWRMRPLMATDLLTVAGGLGVLTLLYMSVDRLLGQVAPRSALWRAP